MSIPDSAVAFDTIMDPHEVLDFKVAAGSLLESGESVAAGTWTLEVLPEGTALGLTIMAGGGRDYVLMPDGQSFVFWLEIDDAFKDNAAFDDGISLPMRLTFQSDAIPYRKRQRTFLLAVMQQ